MSNYIVKIHFTENVRGKPREHVHEVTAVADGPDHAIRRALDYFAQLGRDSWVGWIRTIGKVEVERIARDHPRRGEVEAAKSGRKPGETQA